MAAELAQALDRAKGRERAHHTVIERKARSAPDRAVARLGVERPHERRSAVVVAEQAPAHCLALLTQRSATAHDGITREVPAIFMVDPPITSLQRIWRFVE
jgi:hypothetical protein